MSHPGQKDTGDISRGAHGGVDVTMPLNKRPASSRKMLQAGKYLARVVPEAPEHIGTPELRFPMDDNNAWGDCVVAGLDHALQTIAVAYGLARVNWSDEQILAYYRTQNPSFDPAGSSDDNGPGSNADGGMSVGDFLTYLVQRGELLGFAQVDVSDVKLFRAAIYVGVAVVTGEAMYAQQMQTSTPWDAVGGKLEGGHCTASVAYPDDNTVAVTWGTTVEMTDRFITEQMDEAYLILPAGLPSGRRTDAFDWATFEVDWEEITGRPFPGGDGPAPSPSVQIDDAARARLEHLAAEHGYEGADAVDQYLNWRYDPASRASHADDLDLS